VERRRKRRARAEVEPREISTGPAKVKAPAPRGKNDARSRYIAAAVRDKVFTRDEGLCTFVGPDGRRCASRHALQIDHVKPVARGGASTADNLRLLCAHHNRLEAERLMGPLSRRGDRQASANAP
ncbi:MAG TPA: HNH endonuclease signature motif containing protein, partial [Candidatus Krumholzibacteria bacterium]|nr:HNH endonuclease signature motif containing protein [Candidatus Krumholzibacteria bacterium]